MGRWLAALKKHENGPEANRQNPQKSSKPIFGGFGGACSGENAKISPPPVDRDDGASGFLGVLSVPFRAISENSQPTPEPAREIFGGFGGSASGHIANFFDPVDWTDEDWQAAYDERAGILEYMEGLPRAEAERLARVQVFGDRLVGNVDLTIAREIS